MSKKAKTGPALVATEHFNIAKLWFLIEQKVIEDPTSYISYLLEAKTTQQKWPYASIKTNFEVSPLGFGRLIPKNFCFILMERKVRQTISDGLYTDIDIVNAHPTFLLHILNELGCDVETNYPCLWRYVHERSVVLDEVSCYFEQKHQAKSWFLKVIYGGDGINENQLFNGFMEEFATEMKGLQAIVETNDTLWEFDVSKIKNYLLSKGETSNLHSKILSHAINGMEFLVFEETQKYLQDCKCDLSIYCYDGGMSYKPGNAAPIESLLDGLKSHIFLALNIDLTFAIKHPDEAVFVSPQQLQNFRYDKFQSWIVEQRGDYMCEKLKFEKHNFFGVRDVMYYTEETLYVRSHGVNEFKQKYEHLVFRTEDKKGNPCLKQFLPEWVKDPEKRRYDLVGLFPPGYELEESDVTYYSKWKGFPVERVIPDGQDYSESVNLFRKHTLYLCSGNQQYADYLEKCIVSILTWPGRKLDVVIAFKAVQGGEGKNTWWEIHKELFGGNYCYSTQNHERDWFGDFNELLHEKVWLHMEEMSKQVLIKHQKSFLAYVTSKSDTLNFKGGAKRSVPSFCNYFITFNTGGLDMFPGLRRRIWVHELDKKSQIHSSEYFQRLYKDMKNPQVMRFYFDWLKHNVNIENFSPAEDRPITPYMQRLFEKEFLSKSSTDEFISDCLSSWFFNDMVPNVYKIRFTDVFKMYQTKCKEDQVNNTTPQRLCAAITDMFEECVIRKKIKGHLFLEFNIDECIDTLVQMKMMSWEDLGETTCFDDLKFTVVRPCRKLCKFKACRAHASFHFNDEIRVKRYYGSFNPRRDISHACPCGGSFFIGSNN